MGHHHHPHHAPHSHGAREAGRAGLTRAFAVGVVLNVAFIVVEIVYGILSSSMALIADAAHNVSDVLGLLLAWGASWLARRRPTARRTYGFRRSTILAALTNAIVLFVAVGMVAWEAIERISDPPAVQATTMMVVAAIGVLINGASALMFRHHGHGDINVRGAFLHLMADAAVSLGVVIAGAVIHFTGKGWVDPVVSLAVCVVIVLTARSLLRDSLDLALDAVPAHIDPEAVRKYLLSLPEVSEVHDLHIWAMSTTEVALTAHVVAREEVSAGFLGRVNDHLHHEFGIEHATIQVEAVEGCGPCSLAASEIG